VAANDQGNKGLEEKSTKRIAERSIYSSAFINGNDQVKAKNFDTVKVLKQNIHRTRSIHSSFFGLL
jgi:hypothetical protein